MNSYTGVHCTCYGFSAADALAIDTACGKAKLAITKVKERLALVSADNCPHDIAVALDRHFKIDLAKTKSIFLVYRDIDLKNLRQVYKKVLEDLNSGMEYECESTKNPKCWFGEAYVASFRPKRVHICSDFLENVGSAILLKWGLIHEQVHFASRKSGALNSIGDKAYAIEQTERYGNLNSRQAFRNADSYVWFAREIIDDNFYWPP